MSDFPDAVATCLSLKQGKDPLWWIEYRFVYCSPVLNKFIFEENRAYTLEELELLVKFAHLKKDEYASGKAEDSSRA